MTGVQFRSVCVSGDRLPEDEEAPMTPERYTKVRVLAHKLISSCDGGASNMDDIADLSLEECRLLDSMARECTVCNQWFDVHDMVTGEYVCRGCAS